MPDLDVLRDLTRQLPAPPYDDLVTVARKRRRRSTLAAVAAAAVVVVAVGVGGLAVRGDEDAHGPIQDPTETPSAGAWTPERIRAEGTPGEATPATESGLAWRLYAVCDGDRCEGASGPREDTHAVLEVTQAGRSALFDVRGGRAWVVAFDQDSLLVQDAHGEGPDEPVRARLVEADGTATELRLGDRPVPARPGPGIVVSDYVGWTVGMDGTERLYSVDEDAGTMRPVDAPEDVRYWGPNVEEFLWGVTDDCRVFWAAAGGFEERRLTCRDSDFSLMHDDWFPAGWLRPGRLAMAERSEDGSRMVLHVSLDRGDSWDRIPVPDEDAITATLRELG